MANTPQPFETHSCSSSSRRFLLSSLSCKSFVGFLSVYNTAHILGVRIVDLERPHARPPTVGERLSLNIHTADSRPSQLLGSNTFYWRQTNTTSQSCLSYFVAISHPQMLTGPVDFQSSSPDQPQTAAISESRSFELKMNLSKAARCFGAILLFASVVWVLLLSFPKKQHHLPITHSFGIGFDLSPSYAYVPPIVLNRARSDQTLGPSPSPTPTAPLKRLLELRVTEHTGR